MPKNVVVCCDGTSNQFSVNRTNVAKLCLTLVQQPGVQEVFYHPGLGTMEPPGALTSWAASVTKLLGLAIGYGLPNDIRDAYVFLMNHFEPGDRVYIFGFSRGAYTARGLASLLHMYGLLRPGNEPLAPYAIRMMMSVNALPNRTSHLSPKKRQAAEDIWSLAAEFKRTFSVPCKPAFMGLWDTVNAVGWASQAFHIPYTANNPDIAVARHALAIDERRGFFRPAAWFPKDPPGDGPKDLQQVWFAGCHSDVGGGFAEAESGVSKCALEWMIGEAAHEKLLFDPDRVREMLGATPPGKKPYYIKPNPLGPLHNSMTWFWRLAEFVPKKRFDPKTKTWHAEANLFRRRIIPDGALVHECVFDRGGAYRDHCRNFPKAPKVARTQPVPELGIPMVL